MELSHRHSLQLKQSLKLNQIMIQRFNVLQQSVQEFEDSIHEKAQKNPFIKVRSYRNSVNQIGGSDDSYVSPLDFATYDESLLSTLTTQLDAQLLSEKDYEIVLMLIDELDDKGFLPNYKEIRQEVIQQFSVDERYVFKCLKILQSFEPDGIGARTINECLWNQIDHYGLDDPEEEAHLKDIVKRHLDDLTEKNYIKICQACSISQDQLDQYIDFISHLNPNPAAAYKTNDSIKIEPSLKIIVEDGVVKVINLEEERMSVHLNDDLLKNLDSGVDNDMKQKLAEAKIWIEHYQKRQDLLQRCGEFISQKQRLFFVEGQEYLIPCLQKEMASKLEVSESTISRIVRTKYIECSYGVILFKNLCQRSIYGKTKQQVKMLIEYFCNQYPHLSDQKLSHLLTDIGLPIARRTVTKYRHEISKSSSYERKHSK